LGHSCFKLKGSETTVITDPFSPDLGIAMGKQTARIVTVSHAHRDHDYTAAVDGEPKIVHGPGEYEIGGVLIIGVATFQDDDEGLKRGKNTAYVLEIDEVTVCHLGNLGHLLNAEQLEDIENIDVLLVPVGGGNTINAARAAELVRKIEPRIVIPMHYGNAGGDDARTRSASSSRRSASARLSRSPKCRSPAATCRNRPGSFCSTTKAGRPGFIHP